MPNHTCEVKLVLRDTLPESGYSAEFDAYCKVCRRRCHARVSSSKGAVTIKVRWEPILLVVRP